MLRLISGYSASTQCSTLKRKFSRMCGMYLVEQEQQRLAVLDPETCISFVFARCRLTQPCYGVDSSIDLNYTLRPVRALLYARLLLLVLHYTIVND